MCITKTIYIPWYLAMRMIAHEDKLKGRMSQICQEALHKTLDEFDRQEGRKPGEWPPQLEEKVAKIVGWIADHDQPRPRPHLRVIPGRKGLP